MSKIRLFSARACPYAHRSRLVLEHKGIDFELVEIDLQNKPAWFGEVSLYGKVPALEHDGYRLVESAVINEYLEEAFPAPSLFPRQPGHRAQARIWIDFASNRLAPAFTRSLRGASDRERERGQRELVEAFTIFESEGLRRPPGAGPFWFGPTPSLVDFAFYPWLERLPALEQLTGNRVAAGLPRVREWHANLESLPAVKALANVTEYYVARYRGYAKAPPAELSASADAARV